MFKYLIRLGKRFFHDDEGPTTTEYAILLALIMLTAFLAIKTAGNPIKGMWQDSSTEMNSALEAN